MSQIIEVVERYEIPDLPVLDLPADDGVPMETHRHRMQMNLLIDIVGHTWRERQDFFVGGNMFIYYCLRQARQRNYKGPDFFVVKDIDGRHSRQKWVVWEEDGRYPNVIVELLSPTTAKEDLGSKKELYALTFRTPDYFCYDPETHRLWGWHLRDTDYVALTPDVQGRLWSAELEAWLGTWEGTFQQEPGVWLRLFDRAGQLIPTEAEAERQQAEAERQRADAEYQRADAEYQRADAERQRAEAERQQAEAERQRADAERQQAEAERQRADAERQRADAERQRADAAEAEVARLKAELDRLRKP